MPVLVPLLLGAGAGALAVTAGATVATAAVVGVGAAVISKKTGLSDAVYEVIVEPVGKLIKKVVGSDLGNAVLKVAAVATLNTWAIPLIDGAKVAANGGNVGDVLKAAAISYVGQTVGDVTGKFVTSALVDAGASDFIIKTVASGAKSATRAMVYGQDPLKAFAQGGLTAAVSAGLGEVDTKLRETYGKSFESLDAKVKQSVFSGLKTELSGGDLTSGQVGDIIAKYTGASTVVNEFLKDNVGLTAEAAEVLTRAVTDGVSTAIAGGSGLDAFSGSLSAAGAAALKKIIDKPVYKAIDKVTGAYRKTEKAADALTAQSEKAAKTAEARNGQVDKANSAVKSYNALQGELARKLRYQDRLESEYDAALKKYNGNKTQANANAVTAAINAFNKYSTILKTDYDDNYKDQMAGYKKTANTANARAAKLKATLDTQNAGVTKLQSVYDDALKWVVTETDNLDGALKPKLVEVNKAVALTLRPNIDEDAYREMNGLEAGVDVYEHFLQQGQQLPTDFDGTKQLLASSHGDLIRQVLATEGMNVSSMEPESLRAVAAHVVNNVKNIKDITGLDFGSFAREALTKARDATPKGGVLPTGFSREDGVRDSDIANGSASLGVTSTGEMQWQNTAKVYDRLTGSGSGSYTIEDVEKSLAAQVGAGVSVKFTGTPPTLVDMINTAMEGDFGTLSTSALGTIASLNDKAGQLLDTYVIAPIYEDAKNVYNGLNVLTGGGLGNAGSIAVGAGGELLQAVAGLSVLAGANPNNALGRAAKNMIALSGDMKSDEWKAAAKEMEANSAAYDEKWREDNPGQEPSMAMKGLLKAQAIWGNIQNHPLQWVSENVVSELLQEVPILLASGGTGNVAKRLLLEAGEAQAKKVAARVAIGTGVTLDAAEAFGGTAAGAFDEAYDTALNSGMDEQQATDYAMDVAQKAGSIAVLTLAATAGIGGQALSKSIFGDKGSKTFTDQYNVIKDKVVEGAKVTVKEGVTEFVEEALPQLYIASSLVQIDPSYDVAGSVFEAGIMGKLAGAGTAGGLYTGNALADALLTTNPTVKDAVTNSGSAKKATQALKDLGISDNEVLNNLLNTTYDAQYVTTTEAGNMFVKENPGFTPTDAEIAKFAGTRDEANLATDVAAYVDPRFLDADEVKAAALAEGITLTDEQAKAYVGQKNESSAVTSIRKEYDPQATTYEEAEKFFADLGFTPTKTQINQFVGATPDAQQKTAIDEYVDPRQTTEAEARQMFKDLGYEPTDEEVAARVGQGGAGFQANTKRTAGKYVGPRQTTEAEVRQAFADQGYEPTDEEVAERVGQGGDTFETDTKAGVEPYVDPRQTTEAEVRQMFKDLGYEPTDAEVNARVGQGDAGFQANTKTTAGKYVDPRQTTEAEVRQMFEDLGYEPTDKEVAARVGQGDAGFQANTKTTAGEYVDPRFLDADEVKAAALAEGITLTDEQAEAYVGQKNEASALKEIKKEYDPQGTTRAEAEKFFTDLGFTPTDAEIAKFVGATAENTQKTAIEKYVDPRFLDADEVKAAALAEGITLTDEQAKAYVGQKDEGSTVRGIRKEYDPQGTTRAEAEKFFADLGYTPTEKELTARVGATPDAQQKTAIDKYVDPRQVTEAEARKFYEDLGFTPTDAEIAKFVGQGGSSFEKTAPKRVEDYVDPRQVTDSEARKFFEDLGYNPTDKQVARFVAQVEETTQQDVISKYVDPRQVTQAEVQAIADQEGLTLTETLAATYLGQSEAKNFQTKQLDAARAEYDPLATTLDEATQFFADAGYTATTEEIAGFVASKTEEAQTSAIGAYVDPRQVTAEEAQEFLSAIGYQPTQEEIDQFTGQVNDENYQVTQKAEIDGYVDPRYVDAGEVRATFEALGLVDVSQEDVDRFVGQFDEETQLGEVRDYLPIATFNSIKSIIGSPAVEDDPNTDVDESKDATGIYAELEAGATRDEALEAAIGKVATDLGTTKTDLLAEIGFTKDELSDEIDLLIDDVTGVKEDVADVKGDVADVKGDVSDIADIIGTEGVVDDPDTDVDETQDPTGLFATIAAYEKAGLSRDEALQAAIGDVSTALGTTRADLLDAIGESETNLGRKITDVETGLGGKITDVETGLGGKITDVETGLGGKITDVETGLGGKITDVETTLTELINKNDGDVDAALEELATTLGTTEANILAELGTTKDLLTKKITDVETGLGGQITDVETSLLELINKNAGDVDAALEELATTLGTTEADILAELGTTAETLRDEVAASNFDLTGKIKEVEANLGADIQVVADLIGKPARDVTQTDIDFVIDLIAQENVAAETIQQYDVTGDGVLDINDQNMLTDALQGDQDVTFADTSMFNPATGLYLQQEQDTQATLDAIIDMNTQINTQIQTNQREDNINEMMKQLRASSDATGQRVDVDTPDPMNIDYLYDIGGDSIFATPQQAQLFGSPYGGTRVQQPAQTPANSTIQPRAQRRASGFSEGGQVEDENDMLLRLLGDM